VNDRALPAEELAEYLRSHGAKARACATVEEGILAAKAAAGEDGIIVSFGSLYLAGVVRKEFFRMSEQN
jgi:folylpolyglutamate synthase/dihydropteroate synthase